MHEEWERGGFSKHACERFRQATILIAFHLVSWGGCAVAVVPCSSVGVFAIAADPAIAQSEDLYPLGFDNAPSVWRITDFRHKSAIRHTQDLEQSSAEQPTSVQF